MNKKFENLIGQLGSIYVERDEVIRALVTAVIARRHVVIIGPPGTAKSALVHDLAVGLGGLKYFSWLVTPFTTPEELFGGWDIAAFERGRYRRLTGNKLPRGELVFLDEIFKGSSSILNTLLSIMQERVFYNNGRPVHVPLVSLIGASNEIPVDDEDDERNLQAFWDRLTVRLMVSYIRDVSNFVKMLSINGRMVPVLTRDELFAAQEAAARVEIPPFIRESMARIFLALSEAGITVSDRRYKESLSLLQAAAFLEGRQAAEEEDLLILQHVFWTDPANIGQVRQIVFAVAEPLLVGIQELEDAAREAIKQARAALRESTSTARSDVLEAVATLREVIQKLESLDERASHSPAVQRSLLQVHSQAKNWQAEILQALGV